MRIRKGLYYRVVEDNMGRVKVTGASKDVYPSQGYELDFAHDLYTTEDAIVSPHQVGATLISTGIKTEFDPEKYGLIITPRSSISKLPLQMANSIGIIEGTYRGEILVPLRNTLPVSVNPELTLRKEIKGLEPGTNRLVDYKYSDLPKEVRESYINNLIEYIDIFTINEEMKDNLEVKLEEQCTLGSVFIPKGTRIVQAFLTPKVTVYWDKVDSEEYLTKTKRGEGGYGSTNKGGEVT